jgi:hypothetical protein
MNREKKDVADCCPKFDTVPWDEKTFQWTDKQFIKDTVPQIFHIPLPGTIKRLMGRMWKKAQESNAAPEIKDFIAMAYDPSPWKSEFYIAVTKDVPGVDNVKLSGTFLTKVFDGPYNAVPKWIKEMDRLVASKGKETKKYYFYYTTCPKCAKKYGHNYVVAFAEVQ